MYPKTAGFKETTTSKEAADSIDRRQRAKIIREKCIDLFRININGLTADECAMLIDENVLSVRPRITELKRDGLIEKTGLRRPSSTNTSSHVWRLRNEQTEDAKSATFNDPQADDPHFFG